MPNMSYCRFQNTLSDFRDCYNALSNDIIERLSEAEKKAALKLIKECRDFYQDFEYLIED